MKKSLLALAVLGAFATGAQAQSSVTLYGSIDAGLRYQTNQGPAGPDSDDGRLTMGSNGTYNSNRFGIRGVEDLGGGLNAHFTLESAFNSGTGVNDLTGLWKRTTSVGIGGSWGSLDFGRQYSANFRTIGAYEPFAYKYTGIIPLATQGGITRHDNSIQYTGKFGPVTARVDYALGEVAGSMRDGSGIGAGVVYQAGGITLGGAYTSRKPLVAGDYRDHDNWTVGGAYQTGPFRVALGYADSKQDTATSDIRAKDAWIGGSYSLSPALALSAAYYRTDNDFANGTEGKRHLGIVGLTYALSKRTSFYADVDYSKFKGARIPANGEKSVTGVSAGLNHFF